MSGTVPLSPTAAYVDATGIHAPTFTDIQAFLIGQFQAIYGSDIVVSNDSQDGQMIGVFALAVSDCNAACIAVYNSFSPSTAQGVGLSSNVKLNGISRRVPTHSQADLLLVGQTGKIITNGIVKDTPGNNWALPPSVTFPPTGEITVTATCQTPGAVTAPPGDISRIATVTQGWQTAVNPIAATPGAPVELDPELRERQSKSTALPAQTVLDGILGAVLQLPGVVAGKSYENDTDTDYTVTVPPVGVDPLPPHSIALVIQGGDSVQVCQTILLKKTPGCFTYGNTRETVPDIYGLPHDIGYFIPTQVPIGVAISLKAKTGYSTLVAEAIQNTMAAFIKALGSGEDVIFSKLWLPANLCDATGAPSPGATNTYDITQMTIGTPVGGAYDTANIPITIYQRATLQPADVVITVV